MRQKGFLGVGIGWGSAESEEARGRINWSAEAEPAV